MGKYQEINLASWPRAQHCAVFRNMQQAQYSVSFELDITNFLPAIRHKNYSFTFSLIYTIACCANNIEEFRYRFQDGKVVLYDFLGTSFTYLDKKTRLFKFVSVPMRDSLLEYIVLAEQTAENQKEYFIESPGNDVFVFSACPWISFTHISHTDSEQKDNAVPIFVWGKYFLRGEKIVLPFSVQVHHSFVDGLHIGCFADHIQGALDAYKMRKS